VAIERAEQTSTALLTSLQPIIGDATEIRLQYILTSAGTPRPVPTVKASDHNSAGWWWEGSPPHDAEAVQAARTKRHDPLLCAVVRVGIAGQNQAQAQALFARVWNNYHTLNNVGVRLRRRLLPSSLIAERLKLRRYPVIIWPLLLSSKEGAGLLALPVSGTPLPGLATSIARQLPPPMHLSSHGLVLGLSNYPGLGTRPIALKTDDRLRHQFVLGPTGSGKSWLLANLILQDIAARRGTIVIDPKGDLITDVLSRIEDKDTERVVVLDASQREQPIGLNILGAAADEASRERMVDDVLHVFRSIWAEFWGPRSDALCRAALSTLVATRGQDGSKLTICELVPLLTDPAFRRAIVSQPGLPDSLRAYWQRYEQMSGSGQQQVITPLINKAEAFTSRTAIRLMLGQSDGFDLQDIFTHRKAVLISLAKGTLGEETARLLGSLLVSLLWQATLSRAAIPLELRHPCFAYIDEASDLMRLPVPFPDMAAQARGLGLGLIIATQILAQIPDSFKAAFLGTIRTQSTFAVERDDARLLEDRFAPLTADDLQGLGRFEVALRPCLDGVTHSPLTLATVPLPQAARDGRELMVASQNRYGRNCADVEAALRTRLTTASPNGTVGRRAVGGRS
jgi:Helicase HerA, central domain